MDAPGADATGTGGAPAALARFRWWHRAALAAALAAGAWFRFAGLDWDRALHLHPDERFLTMVETSISPVGSVSEYFDTARSSLNPHNRGHGFFVYGTFPLFAVRYLGEWLGRTGYGQIYLVGRFVSASSDVLTIVLVALIAMRLYRDRRVAVLAAAFASIAVLPIQLSHYFTVDTVATLFVTLALYFAVRIMTVPPGRPAPARSSLRDYLGFGVALGIAAASKISVVPLAAFLPLAALVAVRNLPQPERRPNVRPAAVNAALALAAAFVVFRVLQPYAFVGPAIWDVLPNPRWLANLSQLQATSGGDAEFPPALQWIRRPVWFAWLNMARWGLGWPLGMLAWAGAAAMGWRVLHGEGRRHGVLWLWTVSYFAWQSLAWVRTMRYQLPVYPTLAVMAAWALAAFWGAAPAPDATRWRRWRRPCAAAIGVVTLGATLAWAWAFTRIYARPTTIAAASRWIYENVPGPVNLETEGPDGRSSQPLAPPFEATLPEPGASVAPGRPVTVRFTAARSGRLVRVMLPFVADRGTTPAPATLRVSVWDAARPGALLAAAEASGAFQGGPDARGRPCVFDIEQPVELRAGVRFDLRLEAVEGAGPFALRGASPAVETTWDIPLPVRLDGYDPYNRAAALYPGDLNLEMFWPDTSDKLERLTGILDRADWAFVSSNRVWGSVARLPESYPLSIAFYRGLLACPDRSDVSACAAAAAPGGAPGPFGFELVRAFESEPSLGPLRWNTQLAEEAFSVYDHPRVLIFRKTAAYDPARVRALLGGVDLSRAMRLTPRQASQYRGHQMLSAARRARQAAGGTWAELFDRGSWANRSPVAGAMLWYLTVSLLGWAAYPFVRLALRALPDQGYPFARVVGLLAFAWVSWLLASLGGGFDTTTLRLVAAGVVAVGAYAAWRTRGELLAEWRARRRYLVTVEALALACFLADLLVRIGNPDLWHPYRGGEKPMDFAYLNAVVKSTGFPPYDPWFAGGQVNYYYFGFVIVGAVVKLLGIVPAVAYNLVLPTLFSVAALAAFSIGWNLVAADRPAGEAATRTVPSLASGLAAAALLVLAGNLETARMLWRGLVQLGGGGDGSGGLVAALVGAFRALGGGTLPVLAGQWYWNPTRVVEGAINEFPAFTFLYADLHAHLIALPLTILALGCALAVVLGGWRWGGGKGHGGAAHATAFFCLGAVTLGALLATNSWDYPTYAAVLAAAVFATAGSRAQPPRWLMPAAGAAVRRWTLAAGCAALLLAASRLAVLPFTASFDRAYGGVSLWTGGHTTVGQYLVHWGLFLFVAASLMTAETVRWMAETPATALERLRPYRHAITAAAATVAFAAVGCWLAGVRVGSIVVPLAAWAAVLLLRRGRPPCARSILATVLLALAVTLAVELVVVRGDVGRTNTVFKLYFQAWTLLAVASAACLARLVPAAIRSWRRPAHSAWLAALLVLLAASALFRVMAGPDKIADRISPDAPHTLDGAAFMTSASYSEGGVPVALDEDYRAIRWVQDHVAGSPVIAEAHTVEYRWGSRFAVYTGLPDVVGWGWHERQQRAVLPGDWVTRRIDALDRFFRDAAREEARAFLRRYGVRYVVAGRLERAVYGDAAVARFDAWEGELWRRVYRDGATTIYETLPHAATAAGGEAP